MTSTHYGCDDGSYSTQCGAASYDKSDDRAAVTCKRCLASLAKRDRAFRAKVGAWFFSGSRFSSMRLRGTQFDAYSANEAARAIAREEGRRV